jgi:hypothetical protein
MSTLLTRLRFNVLSWFLIPLGLITALVMVAPSLVVLGFFCLIIPGLLLAIIPTVFVYLLGTVLIRLALPIRSEITANLIAFVLTIGLSALMMEPWRSSKLETYALAKLPEITPREKLKIDGDILLDWTHRTYPPRETVECDFICAALLDTPGVTSVTRVCEQGSATFRRGPNNPGILVTPVDPQDILKKFAKLNNDRKFHGFAVEQQADRAIQAEWALRISQGDELRRTAPLPADRMDWTIKYVRLHEKKQPDVERLEIRNCAGDVVARTSLVRHFVPGSLFWFDFAGGSSADGFSGARFTIGGSTVSNQARCYEFDSAVELLRTVSIPQPEAQADVITQTERALNDVLDNPDATETQLLIAPMWLEQFRYNADHDQLDLIAKILMDDRIADPANLLRVALSSKADLTPLRAGLVKRYFGATDPGSKTWYIKSLVGLADGTFAQPTDEERAIWHQAIDVNEAAPFVERLADQGPDAVPQLMAILDASLEKPWHARWRVLEGICEACKRLGPDATAAAPQIRSLIETSPKALLNSSDDRQQWLVALHLMGVEIKDLPFGVKALEPAKLASESRRILQQVQRYAKDRRAHSG